MIVRNGRRETVDLGAVRHGNNVLHGLTHIATAMEEDQSWRNMTFLFKQDNVKKRRPQTMHEKSCKFCELSFTTPNPQRRYCTERCMKRSYEVRSGRSTTLKAAMT